MVSLNQKQREAVSFINGPLVILAGAGSGKTRVLVSKVIYLIEKAKIDPTSIVMITFTNKAAGEMKKRVEDYFCQDKIVKLGYNGTFHSFCAYILRREGEAVGLKRNFLIYDDNDQEQIIKTVLKKIDVKKMSPSYFLHKIGNAKNQLIKPDRYLEVFSGLHEELSAQIYREYQESLEKNQAVDFDDLINRVIDLFLKNPNILEKYQKRYRFFLIDEFQDTNYAQYVLARILARKYENITVVGDFSQSIYSWRGADIKNLEKFQEDFPKAKIFYLEENYRSTQSILDFAYKVISHNQTHPILKLYTKNNRGEEVVNYQAENEQEEAVFVVSEIQRLSQNSPLSSFVVLYRTNAQSRIFEEALLHFGLPYVLVGGTRFYERKEIKDILSYLRLFINSNDMISLERIKKLGKNRFRKFQESYQKNSSQNLTTVEIMDKIFSETDYLSFYQADDPEDYARIENIKELKSVAFNFPKLEEFLEQVALVESEYFEGEKLAKKDGIKLMTLHQAKGLEFPYVFIVGVEEGLLPHSQSINDLFELEEERRLFYVGITRAKKKLYITYAKKRFLFGRRIEGVKSRFLGEEDQETYLE